MLAQPKGAAHTAPPEAKRNGGAAKKSVARVVTDPHDPLAQLLRDAYARRLCHPEIGHGETLAR